MSLDTDLRTLTLQNAAVVAAIGNRYYTDRIPDGVISYPCIRAVTVTDNPARSHTGTYGGRDTAQLDVYSDTQTTRDSAADALIAWLDNYTGMMNSHRVTIQVRNKPRSWEPESRLYRCMVEIDILYFV